jgi:type II secretory pathway component GspD/PulD (secretin)
MYRDQLQPDEQKMLDAYLTELTKVQQAKKAVPTYATAPTAAAPAGPAGAPAATNGMPGRPAAASPFGNGRAIEPQALAGADAPAASPVETKQKARWLLHQAREQILLGNYDEAQKKADAADAMDVKWGLFDDTPAKVGEDITKARPKATVAKAGTSDAPHDRRAAKAKLREARTMLNDRNFEQAEAIALDVKKWGLSYGMLEDTPDKVAAAARALRHRDKIRNTPAREQSSQGVYDVLVQEARQLMAAGKLEEAESKARKAQKMDVVPGLTTDRAESVLHEIAMAKAQKPTAVLAKNDANAQKLEREANELLAKGDQAGAIAKFAESERSQTNDAALKLTATAPVDASVTLSANMSAPAAAAPAAPAGEAAAPAFEFAAAEPAAAVGSQPAPAAPASAKPAAAEPNRGEQLLSEAKALFTNGNYPAAKQLAAEAKAGKFGVDAQADEMLAQIALTEQGGALKLYEEALTALREGNASRAKAMLTEVAAAGDSLDENLRSKVQAVLTKLSGDEKVVGKASTSDVVLDPDALAAQKLNAEVGTQIAEARRYLETDPDKAMKMYEKTMLAVRASGLSPDLTRPMVRRLEVAMDYARQDKAKFEIKMQDKVARAEIEQKRLRILEADKAKKTRLSELMEKAQAAYALGNYVEAETFAKKAVEIDPNELAASMMVFKAKMERRYKTDLENRAEKEDAVVRTFQEVDKASIADPEVQLNAIKYAKDFGDLTKARLAMNAKLEPKKDPRVMAITSKLNEKIQLNFDKTPLSETISFLQNYTGLNIVADPKALSEEGLSLSSPVTLTVNGITIKSALKLMLRPLGLTYKVEDEVVLITSPQASQAQTFARTYYVGDLIAGLDSGGGNPVPGAILTANQEQAGVTQGMPSLINPNGGPTKSTTGPNGETITGTGKRPSVDMMPLIQLISSSVAPGTWSVRDERGNDVSGAYGMGGGFGGDAGGVNTERQPGAIVPFYLSISLIIRHTAEVHEQVADLLKQLRRLQDLQVSVEVRFITVSDNFYEYIGVDFDFQINSKTVGPHSTFAAANPSASLFPVNGVSGLLTTGGTSTSTSTSSSTSSGSSSTTGGSSSGSSTGGGSSGGLSGGGTGGTAGGGSSTSGGGSSSGGSVTQPNVYVVNPNRDNVYGSNTPYIVGTQGAGLGNFTNNLAIPFNNTQSSFVQPSGYQSGQGATFGIAFLSDLEVYLFLTAAQGDSRANVLQAPKVTTFNGAPAYITSGTLQYYIQTLTPIVGFGAVAFTPGVGQINNGVALQVTPVVSADRRYVRMTLSPFFTAVNGFFTVNVPAAVGGGGVGGNGVSVNGVIQLPNVTYNSVSTTVTVPDGGTVLLGGVKTLNEQRLEYGVPVLSKTPLLDRLFRNVGIGRTTTSLMLMVTPRIIILEEEEEKLGIPSVAL